LEIAAVAHARLRVSLKPISTDYRKEPVRIANGLFSFLKSKSRALFFLEIKGVSAERVLTGTSKAFSRHHHTLSS
jgi:hypothetical protein